jgi:hypothetical protein
MREVYACDPGVVGQNPAAVPFGSLMWENLLDQVCLNWALAQRDAAYQPGAGPRLDAAAADAHAVVGRCSSTLALCS